MYRQDGKTIIKSSDSSIYNVVEDGDEIKHKNEWQADHTERFADTENIVDALAGNFQNYITLNDNLDGSKDLKLKLTDNQVSPVINAVASLVVKNAGREHGSRAMGEHKKFIDPAFAASLQDKIPKLVDNIRVNSVEIDAKINKDNLIQEQTGNLVITGTDENGNAHEIVLIIDTTFSDYNSTKPDTVDLDGKQVKLIEHKNFRRER